MMAVITLRGMPLCNMKPALFPVISISEVSDLVRPVCSRFPDFLRLSVYGSRDRGEAHEGVLEEFEGIMFDLEDAVSRLLSETDPVPALTDRPWAVDDIMSRRTGSTAF